MKPLPFFLMSCLFCLGCSKRGPAGSSASPDPEVYPPIPPGQEASSPGAPASDPVDSPGPAQDSGPSGRPFAIALYHGGVSSKLSELSYGEYLDKLAGFVTRKKIDKVFLDIGDYQAMPYQSVKPLADFLNALPGWVEVGGVLEINPKYSFQTEDMLLAGGLGCTRKSQPAAACPASDNPDSFPAGCPNNMEKAFSLLARANALALQQRKDTALFTSFIFDKENAGIYGGRICNLLESAKTFIVPGLPDGFRGASSAEEKLALVRVGEAGEGSMNPIGLLHQPICSLDAAGSTLDADCVSYPYKRENVEAYPELYWYMQELKEQGCIGCDHTLPPDALAARTPQECAACYDGPAVPRPACQGFIQFFSAANYALYDSCKQSCPEACCKCLGCVPCRHDPAGNAPNPAILYQQHLNQPKPMAKAVVAAVEKLHLLDNLKQPNTWSMFSLELAHDWGAIPDPVSGKTYQANGADSTSPHTCIARKFGGDICGTFDGFGNWSWEAFEQFLTEYHALTGIKKMAIYEWQFVFPEWLE